ncbi:ABC transporter permease [Candidatus Bathyarchaeota archaeon A05DMB-2]|jgi:ABC-type antimicrobial peptide transport system permease subunit|nr:ABC transporter permease [Candidatus Bathyarchaeota archaeon A05DMB-2]
MGILTRASRNIARRKARALLLIVVLSLALAVITSLPPNIIANQQGNQGLIDQMLGAIQSSSERLNLTATQIDCNLGLQFLHNQGPYKNVTMMVTPFLNISDYANLTSIPEIADVIPMLLYWQPDEENFYFNFTYNGYTYRGFMYIWGIPLEASYLEKFPSVIPTTDTWTFSTKENITAGRNLEAGDRGVVVLQEFIANYFNASVGDTVNILGQNFTVVGIQGTGRYPQYFDIYMNLEDAQKITNTTGQASKLLVFADKVENVDTVENKIKEQYPERLEVTTNKAIINQALENKAEWEKNLQNTQAAVDNLKNTAIMEMGLVVVAQVAIMLFVMLYAVRERTREIGTLKAMGASNSTILGQFMLEGIILSLIAGIIGVVIGTVGASAIGNLLIPRPTDVGFEISVGGQDVAILAMTMPEFILAGLGIAVALGALGSLYPAWRAAKIRPAEAMRHE